jgi:hypothetical protein
MPTKKVPKGRSPSKKLPDPIPIVKPRKETTPEPVAPIDYDAAPQSVTGETPHENFKERLIRWLRQH